MGRPIAYVVKCETNCNRLTVLSKGGAMVGPKDIQNRPLPGQFQRPTTTQTPTPGKKSPAGQAHDAARVAQGAGFVRQEPNARKPVTRAIR